jgi:Cu-processing system permease protein
MAVLVAIMTFTLLFLADDVKKTLLSLTIIFCALIPLVALLFTSLYWYHSERFTELLLTQPISRKVIFLSRAVILGISLIFALSLGVIIPFLWFQVFSADIIFFLSLMSLLALVFVNLGLLISVSMSDKMKAMGVVLGIWMYLLMVHDGIVLIGLLLLKGYPTNTLALVAGTLNPIGLARILLIRYFDQPMLLSFTGARVQLFLSSTTGLIMALITGLCWIFGPLWLGLKSFIKRDY